nr:PepSY domain-containing protein [Fusobacterium gastrosuis]
MKNKKSITKLALIGTLVLGGVSLTTKSYATSAQINQEQIITLEEANKIALKQTKDGKILKSELDHNHGRTIYEIEILENNIKKEIDIDAVSGQILKIDNDDRPSHRHMQTPIEAKISIDEAKAIALKNSSNGTLKSIELDSKRGLPFYEVEILENNIEKEIRIDATNGNIIKFKDNHKKHNNMMHSGNMNNNMQHEMNSSNMPNHMNNNMQYEMNSSNMPNHMNNKMSHAMNSEAKISIDEAKTIALKNSSNGTLKSIELKNKKGLPYYEIEISEGLLEKEFKIDAINGNILKVERDF